MVRRWKSSPKAFTRNAVPKSHNTPTQPLSLPHSCKVKERILKELLCSWKVIEIYTFVYYKNNTSLFNKKLVYSYKLLLRII